jgi:hypothetical protein
MENKIKEWTAFGGHRRRMYIWQSKTEEKGWLAWVQGWVVSGAGYSI